MKRPPRRVRRFTLLVGLLVLVALALGAHLALVAPTPRRTDPISNVAAALRAGSAARLTVDGARLPVEYRDGRPPTSAKIDEDARSSSKSLLAASRRNS